MAPSPAPPRATTAIGAQISSTSTRTWVPAPTLTPSSRPRTSAASKFTWTSSLTTPRTWSSTRAGRRPTAARRDYPYKDASGKVFDDRDYAGTANFPTLDAATSFPYVPTFATDADRTVKNPAWLNDPIYYHNRGNSTFQGESSLYGDFSGLDDLFTEQPTVVNGLIDVYKKWIDAGADGFRIDTVKHVNLEFWQQFGPALMSYAKSKGKPDFFMFGEVYDSNPAFTSVYTTKGQLPGVLDFAFQGQAANFAVRSDPTDKLRDLFASRRLLHGRGQQRRRPGEVRRQP